MEDVALYHDSENYKPIKGYEGLYEVSNFGNIRSVTRKYEVFSKRGGLQTRTRYGRIIKPRLQNSGYKIVWLSKNGIVKAYTVHRIVANTFIENPKNLYCVNHKDGDKTNNKVSNLEWCSSSENLIHAYEKLNRVHRQGRKVLCVELKKKFNSIREAANELKINASSIGNCIKGDTKHAGGYTWKKL